MTAREWSPTRHRIHLEAFPPEQKGERNRQAQADYRARHRKQLDDANTVRAILVRQDTRPGDDKVMAAALVRLLGAEYAAQVQNELVSAIVGGGNENAVAWDRSPWPEPDDGKCHHDDGGKGHGVRAVTLYFEEERYSETEFGLGHLGSFESNFAGPTMVVSALRRGTQEVSRGAIEN
jgi:hypothetical protein